MGQRPRIDTNRSRCGARRVSGPTSGCPGGCRYRGGSPPRGPRRWGAAHGGVVEAPRPSSPVVNLGCGAAPFLASLPRRFAFRRRAHASACACPRKLTASAKATAVRRSFTRRWKPPLYAESKVFFVVVRTLQRARRSSGSRLTTQSHRCRTSQSDRCRSGLPRGSP